MSRASVLARGRAAAEAGMQDQCLIQSKTESTDPETGVVTPNYSTVYEGRCRFQETDSQARQETAGESYLLMFRRQLQIPMSVTGVRAGHQVTCTASVNDADLVNRVFVVRDEFAKSEATSRRLGIEEATS